MAVGFLVFTDDCPAMSTTITIANGGDLSQLWDNVWVLIETGSGTEIVYAEYNRYQAVSG